MLDQWELPAGGLYVGQDRGGWWQLQSESFSMASAAGPKNIKIIFSEHQSHFSECMQLMGNLSCHGVSSLSFTFAMDKTQMQWASRKIMLVLQCTYWQSECGDKNCGNKKLSTHSIFTVLKCCLNFTATTLGVGINIPDLTKWELKLRGEQQQDLVPRCSSPFILPEGSKQGWQMASGDFGERKRGVIRKWL